MSLTSSSTITEAKAQYYDNLVWEGDSSKAINMLEAIRFLLLAEPDELSKGDRKVVRAELLRLLPRLEKSVAANQSNSSKIRLADTSI